MPDTRSHRGPDPRDGELFAPEQWPALRQAVADLSWLLGRGYAEASALKLVGDRHRLTERQRMAVRRGTCSDAARDGRLSRRVGPADLRGQPLWIDGFNVLTTIEAALGGACLFRGRDGNVRDLTGVHGTYRRVEETVPSIRRVGQFLATYGIGPCTWLLDRPVSNSGRLRALLLVLAAAEGWTWSVELPFNPDAELIAAGEAVATADSGILDRCGRWCPLASSVLEAEGLAGNVVDLSPAEDV